MANQGSTHAASVATPGQTVGPFFHYALPFAGGNDLVPAPTSDAVRLHGVVFDGHSVPVPDALVEIRQADANGHIPAAEGSFHRGTSFTGWGRSATDSIGRYSFTTIEPGAPDAGAVPFFAVVVFARGLLDRLFTRVYLPEVGPDAFLDALPTERRHTLVATRDGQRDLRFDIHLQGDHETVFLKFPRHNR